MGTYYLNKDTRHNPNCDNEVHLSTCKFMPSDENKLYLGVFSNGVQAVQHAKMLGYDKADGCIHCALAQVNIWLLNVKQKLLLIL